MVGIVVTLGLGAVPSAVAADPDVKHFTITESFTDDNFCGTGQAVDTSVSVKGTEFLAPNQPVDSRNVAQVKVVYTNPQNGATVLRHAAGPVSDTIISGGQAAMLLPQRSPAWHVRDCPAPPGREGDPGAPVTLVALPGRRPPAGPALRM